MRPRQSLKNSARCRQIGSGEPTRRLTLQRLYRISLLPCGRNLLRTSVPSASDLDDALWVAPGSCMPQSRGIARPARPCRWPCVELSARTRGQIMTIDTTGEPTAAEARSLFTQTVKKTAAAPDAGEPTVVVADDKATALAGLAWSEDDGDDETIQFDGDRPTAF